MAMIEIDMGGSLRHSLDRLRGLVLRDRLGAQPAPQETLRVQLARDLAIELGPKQPLSNGEMTEWKSMNALRDALYTDAA